MAGSPRDGAHRTAAACSGGVLCGDFGTPDLRRFMVLGALLNTLINFERVSAQLGSVLVDECVGADADVGKHFFTALVERLCFAKRGEKPFLVWMVTGRRLAAGGNEEWMYELERLRGRRPSRLPSGVRGCLTRTAHGTTSCTSGCTSVTRSGPRSCGSWTSRSTVQCQLGAASSRICARPASPASLSYSPTPSFRSSRCDFAGRGAVRERPRKLSRRRP
eukprot:TRINITY_DN7796_c0_g3_i3.p2 TRINITY_DN7796_c0_g3~~TRINITY_DN7796_c0_g3_i3.p2  ORF type:complete len:245 (+),score=28.25 TRINITY_DN7796_c0_g3_i3:76-735(+)